MNSRSSLFAFFRHLAAWFAAFSFLCAVPPTQAAPTTPTTDFTDNGDGTVTHRFTGLTWKRCIEGMTWTGTTCSGTASTYTWEQATALSTSDWRLPTIAELNTIVERDASDPAINTTIFPSTPSSLFWSATELAGRPAYAWDVHFGYGYAYGSSKADNVHVRLVRSGRPLDPSGLYTPSSDFADHGDGTVTHLQTSLTWKRCAEGKTWSGSTCTGTASRITWSQANALSTGDWRLPTANELSTLAEYSIAGPGPAINTTVFPGTPASSFWSASEYAPDPALAWHVAFYNGGTYAYDNKALNNYVRLVRGGQIPPTFPSASSNSERVFNWGASAYPHLFAPANADTQSLQGYTYRYYSGTNSYLGEKDGRLYYIGTLSGNQLLDIGAIADYLPQAQAAGF